MEERAPNCGGKHFACVSVLVFHKISNHFNSAVNFVFENALALSTKSSPPEPSQDRPTCTVGSPWNGGTFLALCKVHVYECSAQEGRELESAQQRGTDRPTICKSRLERRPEFAKLN